MSSSITAENVENNPDIEKQWAVKAYHHAETYLKLISTVKPTNLKLTKIDDEIYEDFKSTFPGFKIDNIDEEEIKSEKAKVAWRNFIMKYENKIEDYNFGTLLRIKAPGAYTPENTTFATRLQFYAIEIARNKEGIN